VSHVVQIETEIRDVAAARAACNRLQLEPPIEGRAQLFSGEATGLIVKLPDWKYAVVFNVTTGEAKYDNYNGRWGDQARLDEFLQSYAVEKAKIEARKKGHSCTEQQLEDGSIKLTINMGVPHDQDNRNPRCPQRPDPSGNPRLHRQRVPRGQQVSGGSLGTTNQRTTDG